MSQHKIQLLVCILLVSLVFLSVGGCISHMYTHTRTDDRIVVFLRGVISFLPRMFFCFLVCRFLA